MADFPPDFCIQLGEQVFRPHGSRQHVTRDGRTIRMLEWLTNCPACGTEFTSSTTMRFKEPRRRCDACKAPGRKVMPGRPQPIGPIIHRILARCRPTP